MEWLRLQTNAYPFWTLRISRTSSCCWWTPDLILGFEQRHSDTTFVSRHFHSDRTFSRHSVDSVRSIVLWLLKHSLIPGNLGHWTTSFWYHLFRVILSVPFRSFNCALTFEAIWFLGSWWYLYTCAACSRCSQHVEHQIINVLHFLDIPFASCFPFRSFNCALTFEALWWFLGRLMISLHLCMGDVLNINTICNIKCGVLPCSRVDILSTLTNQTVTPNVLVVCWPSAIHGLAGHFILVTTGGRNYQRYEVAVLDPRDSDLAGYVPYLSLESTPEVETSKGTRLRFNTGST